MAEDAEYFRRLRSRERQAFAVILLERATASFWRPLFWIAAFIGLFLLDLPFFSGPAAGNIIRLLFFIGLAVLIIAAFAGFRSPGRIEIRRRLEEDSGIAHRPLASIDDLLANPESPITRDIWELRGKGLVKIIESLRFPSARPQLAVRDPYALRFIALALLAAGLLTGGFDWRNRLGDKFRFDLSRPGHAAAKESRVTIRVEYPEYTGLAEKVLQSFPGNAEPLPVIEESRIRVRVTGGIGTPRLHFGKLSLPLKNEGNGTYMLDAPALPSEKISISQTLISIAEVPVRFIRDAPPSISMTGAIQPLDKGGIRFPLKLSDDFGVNNLDIRLELDDSLEGAVPVIGAPLDASRLVMSRAGAETDIYPVFDFSSHTWAGLPVKFYIAVTDTKGQKTGIYSEKTILPERSFEDPVSQILIELRRQLAWMPESSAFDVRVALENLLLAPGVFENDFISFLIIRAAASRLGYAPGGEGAKAVIPLLWDVAVRLDGGSLTLARRELLEVQQALEDELSKADPDAGRIEMLMQEMRLALGKYLLEMGRSVAGHNGLSLPPGTELGSLDSKTLSAVLEKLHSLALAGETADARELLSKIRRMMDALDSAQAIDLPPDMQFMDRGRNELKELVDRQKELLAQSRYQQGLIDRAKDQTYGRWLPGGRLDLGDLPPPPAGKAPGIDTGSSFAAQEALRFALGQLMREADEILGSIPEGMGLAEQEMRASSANLAQSRPGLSMPHQQNAIDYLQQARQDMSSQLAARMQQIIALSISPGGLDPLGRPMEGGEEQSGKSFFDSDVKIPEESERKKIEEILKILRRRSGELSRPEEELEYFRRLLRQF